MNDALIADESVDEVEATEVEAEEVETDETDEPEAAGDDQSDEEPSTSEDDDEQEKRDKVQERIDEITRIRREEERQRIAAERENERLRQELEQLKPKRPAGMKLADFDYDEERFSEYVAEQIEERARVAAEEQLTQQKAADRMAEFAKREDQYAAQFDDYHQATRNPELRITQPMVAIAQGSDNGPAILYHLAKNPEQAARISMMQPVDIAREFGRIEATAVQRPTSITKAPEPTPKLKAAEKAKTIRSDSPESDKLSVEEWKRRELKRLANRNK